MAAPGLTRFRDFARRHRFAPVPHTPPANTPAERRRWLGPMLACWLMMAGALIAASALISSTLLLVELAVVVLAAFPVAWRLHFSAVPRFWPNQLTFLAALVLGIIHWRMGVFTGGEDMRTVVASYRTLVGVFYWIMAFRAFAVRNVRDLTQTALPAVSGLLLVLIAAPTTVACIGTALVMGGTLALLAAEHAAARSAGIDRRIPAERVRGGAWRPTVNSWLSLLLAAAVAATIIAALAARYQPSNELARSLRRQLAWRLARLMMVEEATSWTAQSTLALGGPAPTPQDRLMLIIRCETPVKPRTAVYDIYDGALWRQSQREWRRVPRLGDVWRLPTPAEMGTAPAATDVVDVEITSAYGFLDLLPVPYCAQEIDLNVPSLRVDRAGMVSFTGHVLPGDTYLARVAMPAAVTTRPGSQRPAPTDMTFALQLPDTLPKRVRLLARHIVTQANAGVTTTKVIAIENYLRDPDNFTYDLDAPWVPAGRDYVDYFLFTSRRGYCNHFATAMAVMVRCLGIPARLATGFTAGQYRPDRDVYEIRDQDAHAWVEVFLPDTGWVDFDPTPDVQTEAQPTGAARGAIAAFQARWRVTAAWLASHAFLVAALAILLAAAIVGITAAVRRYRRQLRLLRPGAPARDRIIHAYRQALHLLARAGLTRLPSAAPWEFQRITAGKAPSLAQEFALLTEKYVGARFAPEPPPVRDAEAAEGALLRLRDAVLEPDEDTDETAESHE